MVPGAKVNCTLQTKRPGTATEMTAKHIVHEADHRPDDFRRRGTGTRELTERVVVNAQEVFGPVLADGVPVHGVEAVRARSRRGSPRTAPCSLLLQSGCRERKIRIMRTTSDLT